MSDPLNDLNLILLPDWLKEPADKNPYANYEGEQSSRGRRGDHPRRNGPRRDGPPGRGPRSDRSDRPERRGPRPPQGARPPLGAAQGKGEPRPQRPDGKRPPRGPRPERRDGPAEHQRREAPAQPQQPAIPLQVDFIAEAEGISAFTQQIRSTPKAYPLYSLARMFLNKPERHRVRITTLAPACPIYRIGEDGPILLQKVHAERDAFRALRSTYYSEEVQQIDPPKGNFTNVARCRVSGVLLGPTNHHDYQPALRRLYEARFSRRCSFEQFLRQIEVVSDPAVVEQWKTEASSITLFRTQKEEEPVEFKTLQEVEAHFKAHYLEQAVQAHQSVEISGVASRELNNRTLREAIRLAWEKERTYPAQLANQLRPHFAEAGFQIWKHRKRILYVSTVRPVRFAAEGTGISEGVAAILGAIEAAPRCTRADLSAKLLTPSEDEAEMQKGKAALAADLHWLISSGHVIEFHDATLDLPLPPRETAPKESGPSEADTAKAQPSEGAEEASAEASASAAVEAPTVEAPTVEAPAVEAPAAEAEQATPVEAAPAEVTSEAPPSVTPAAEEQAPPSPSASDEPPAGQAEQL